MHAQFALVQPLHLFTLTSDLWAELLRWPQFCLSIMRLEAWNHRILVVVVLLPCDQIILIHFLLHISHIAVGSEDFLTLNLIVKIALVLILHIRCLL